MILKEDSTEQKLRGAYYTPLKLAKKMVDFFKKRAKKPPGLCHIWQLQPEDSL